MHHLVNKDTLPKAGGVHTKRLPPLVSQKLRNHHILQYNRAMENVVEFVGLEYSRRSDRVHNLGYEFWIERAEWIGARRCTDAKRELPRCRGESARLVRTKTVLARQRHREAPTRRRCSTQ